MHKLFNHYFLLFLLTLLGLFLYFYNLNWGSPHYFHPDERNIASSISQLRFPEQMNPHFFAYGSLPIYTLFFIGLLYKVTTSCQFQLANCTVTFEEAIIISRILSAILATLLIPLLFFLGRMLHSTKAGLFTAFFSVTSVGFLQFSHYGTFEMWLTFFALVLLIISLSFLRNHSEKYIVLTGGIVLGVLIAVKVSSLVLLPLPLIPILVNSLKHSIKWPKRIFSLTKNTIGIISLAALVYSLTNPFVLLDTTSFVGSMQYESSVALGTLPVFYTGEFYATIPVLYHFVHVFPFLLNPLLTILFIPAFIFTIFYTVKTRNANFILLTSSFILLFLSQAFLFIKWIRYMVPTVPFMYITVALFLVDIFSILKTKNISFVIKPLSALIGFVCILFVLSYFTVAFIEKDTRIAGASWAKEHIPNDALILSEVYDMGIVPFNPYFPHIRLYNFYELDNNNPQITLSKLFSELSTYDYIVLPSQRILKTRLLHNDTFKEGRRFYQSLLNGSLGFQTVYQTPCSIFCTITYLGNPLWRYETTANVFDRPIVMIFKNTRGR